MTHTKFVKKPCLKHFELDYGILISQDKEFFFSIYINDLVLFTFDKLDFINIEHQLSAQFKITNLGREYLYLDIEVDVEV